MIAARYQPAAPEGTPTYARRSWQRSARHDISSVLKEIDAIELRRSSKVARALERGGVAILLRVAGKAVGVIVSIEEYRDHVERDRTHQREELVEAIVADRASTEETIEDILDAVRARRRRSAASWRATPASITAQ